MNALSLAHFFSLPPTVGRPLAVSLFLLSLLVHLGYFVWGRRYVALQVEFEASPPFSPMAGIALVWAYVLCSLGLFFSVLSLRGSAA